MKDTAILELYRLLPIDIIRTYNKAVFTVHTGPEVVNKFVYDYPGLKLVSKDLG